MKRATIIGRSAESLLVPLIAGLIAIAISAGCTTPSAQPVTRFATAEQVQLNFQGNTFVLGDNSEIALVRPVSWQSDRFLRLPFWLGVNVLVPGVMQPKEGDYYVISEAVIVRKLDAPDQWLIEAGSSLLKQDAIFASAHTHYKTAGKILPTIVQFAGMRKFPTAAGGTVDLPLLSAISLPMKWTLPGPVPDTYARFEVQ